MALDWQTNNDNNDKRTILVIRWCCFIQALLGLLDKVEEKAMIYLYLWHRGLRTENLYDLFHHKMNESLLTSYPCDEISHGVRGRSQSVLTTHFHL